MCEVHQEDETDEDEHAGTDRSDIRAVGHEEFVRDQEAEETEDDIAENFRSPPASPGISFAARRI